MFQSTKRPYRALETSLARPALASASVADIPEFLTSRNNSFSNARIPYARIVVQHGRDALRKPNGEIINEYDDLHAGELVWILSNKIMVQEAGSNMPLLRVSASQSMPLRPPAHAATTLPFATTLKTVIPERTPRLASTSWIAQHYEQRVGRKTIDLLNWDPCGHLCTTLDDGLAFWSRKGLAGSTLFAMTDVAHVFSSDPVSSLQPQGLFAMSKSLFLHSMLSHGYVTLSHPLLLPKRRHARSLGSELATTALECLLRFHGLKSWVPDGVCLGVFGNRQEADPHGRASTDTAERVSSLLVNVAVQGPTICSTWAGDPLLRCVAGDKVFILLVADMHYELGAADTTKCVLDLSEDLRSRVQKLGVDAHRAEVFNIEQELERGVGRDADANVQQPINQQTDVEKKYATWHHAIKQYSEEIEYDAREAEMGKSPSADRPTELAGLKSRAQVCWDAYTSTVSPLQPLDESAFDTKASELRNGKLGVARAKLSNFRLKRATASYLAEFGAYDHSARLAEKSRCGLSIAFHVGGGAAGYGSGTTAYVVGGWCVGNVLDAAASRAASRVKVSSVATDPGSMAFAVNVYPEWWSADRLHERFG